MFWKEDYGLRGLSYGVELFPINPRLCFMAPPVPLLLNSSPFWGRSADQARQHSATYLRAPGGWSKEVPQVKKRTFLGDKRADFFFWMFASEWHVFLTRTFCLSQNFEDSFVALAFDRRKWPRAVA